MTISDLIAVSRLNEIPTSSRIELLCSLGLAYRNKEKSTAANPLVIELIKSLDVKHELPKYLTESPAGAATW